jgi:hypothetical protein
MKGAQAVLSEMEAGGVRVRDETYQCYSAAVVSNTRQGPDSEIGHNR